MKTTGNRFGERWRECDRCGFDFPISKLRRDYTGALVCEDDYHDRGYWENKADMELPVEGLDDKTGGDLL